MVNLDFIQPLPVSCVLNFGTEWVPPPPPTPTRRITTASGHGWAHPGRKHTTLTGRARTPSAKDPANSLPWNDTTTIHAETQSPWRDKGQRESAILTLPWDIFTRTETDTRATWIEKEKRNIGAAAPWETPMPQQLDTTGAYRNPDRRWVVTRIPWGTPQQYGTPLSIAWERLTWRQKRWDTPWGTSGAPINTIPPHGVAIHPQPTEPIKCDYQPIKGHATLNFTERQPASTRLQYWCHAPTEHCINRSLLLLPTAAIIKLPAREPLAATQIALDLDIDSWSWSLRATVPSASLALILPGNEGSAEIEINLSGHVWRMLVEGFAESHEFGSAAYTITGRSTAAILAAPYAPTRTHTQNNDRTARQLADEELENTGWSLDWQTEDWLIPGGVWSYDNLTPMDAIARIAAAVGAVIRPHPSEKILTISPRHRFSPWNLSGAAANNTLDPSLLTGLSLQWSPKPKTNGVYTSGQHQGITAFTRRAGTAGDRLAQMVVDSLITTPEAGKERGRQILSAAGNKAKISVSLPLTAYGTLPGLVQPGAVVEVPESPSWKGIATAIGITADRQNDAMVLKQHVEIERHYE